MDTAFKTPKLPSSIPFPKLGDVCRILGLPADEVRALTTDANERRITVTLYVLDAEGHKIVDPSGNGALTYDVSIPVTRA